MSPPRAARSRALACAALALLPGATHASAEGGPGLPFGPGERLAFRITYARFLAGRAWLRVDDDDRGVFRLGAEAKSQGFFAWLFRFRVDDHTVARWDPVAGASLGIEKHLREGRAERDQSIVIDPTTAIATVADRKIKETMFVLEPGVLDVLSALYVTRVRGVPETEPLLLPVFDNGKHYRLGVRFLGRERLDLPPPLGRSVPTVIVEPQLLEGTGLFVKEGRLKIWLTDDARRLPVRMRAKVAIGSVSADLESYTPADAAGPLPGRSTPLTRSSRLSDHSMAREFRYRGSVLDVLVNWAMKNAL